MLSGFDIFLRFGTDGFGERQINIILSEMTLEGAPGF